MMNRSSSGKSYKSSGRVRAAHRRNGQPRLRQHGRPATAHRHRGGQVAGSPDFNAPEIWHEPTGREEIRYVVEPPGEGYRHPVSVEDVKQRLELLPRKFTRQIEVIQFSRMTRKRALFPCYGMQWGPNIYLYPIEESLVESYVRPPLPAQRVEARMYGAEWTREDGYWQLRWSEESVRDFYLNNVLIHEIGHVNDERNTTFATRERYAEWFAIEYGYRP
ncbi:MAG: hypothetical protein KDA79_22425, partial [Planctomycetaceae bacterium]|nr:hypothetical protein [Planctomycetaceae bacterium]